MVSDLSLIRTMYRRYYGSVLAMYRIKDHTYLYKMGNMKVRTAKQLYEYFACPDLRNCKALLNFVYLHETAAYVMHDSPWFQFMLQYLENCELDREVQFQIVATQDYWPSFYLYCPIEKVIEDGLVLSKGSRDHMEIVITHLTYIDLDSYIPLTPYTLQILNSLTVQNYLHYIKVMRLIQRVNALTLSDRYRKAFKIFHKSSHVFSFSLRDLIKQVLVEKPFVNIQTTMMIIEDTVESRDDYVYARRLLLTHFDQVYPHSFEQNTHLCLLSSRELELLQQYINRTDILYLMDVEFNLYITAETSMAHICMILSRLYGFDEKEQYLDFLQKLLKFMLQQEYVMPTLYLLMELIRHNVWLPFMESLTEKQVLTLCKAVLNQVMYGNCDFKCGGQCIYSLFDSLVIITSSQYAMAILSKVVEYYLEKANFGRAVTYVQYMLTVIMKRCHLTGLAERRKQFEIILDQLLESYASLSAIGITFASIVDEHFNLWLSDALMPVVMGNFIKLGRKYGSQVALDEFKDLQWYLDFVTTRGQRQLYKRMEMELKQLRKQSDLFPPVSIELINSLLQRVSDFKRSH
ncbi:hypothetical protein MIR68_007789 [Amoeboaphelidium protococcarum]|nr:hypothetical protein MIR68_007789 [Amoeboaphelidium protococcarum]